MIQYDFNNLRAERIGGHGVSDAEINALQPRLQQAFDNVRAMRQEKKLGFFDLPYDAALAREITDLAGQLKQKFENFVVIGIGGSALGNIAIQSALNHPEYNLLPNDRRRGLRLFIPDNIDPDRLHGVLDALDLSKTVFNVITKSGNTAESIATYLIARERVIKAVGREKHCGHFIFTTDAEKGELKKIAAREKARCLVIPATVGGRFSVLSSVGLLSAAATGVDIKALLNGTAKVDRNQQLDRPGTADPWKNPALLGAAYHYLLAVKKQKNVHIMYSYSHHLRDVADWFRQLWAESLGKRVNRKGQVVNVGQTPEKSVGVTDQHSQVQLYVEGPYDKVITFLSVEEFNHRIEIPSAFEDVEGFAYLGAKQLGDLFHYEERATELVITSTGRPNCAIRLSKVDEETLGGLFFLLELQTAYIGELYNINTFDQPGVEQGKNFAYGLLGRKGYEECKTEFESAPKPDPRYVVTA